MSLPTDFHVQPFRACECRHSLICRSCLELVVRALRLLRNHVAVQLGDELAGPLAADAQRARRGRAFRSHPHPKRRRRTPHRRGELR